MIQLVIGNKLYSSWSMRPWLLLKAFDIPFEEIVIPLYRDGSRERIQEHSPTGKVPCLIDGVTVWDSLSIMEYLAETYPGLDIWPREKGARAHARSAAAEMHSGFQALRQSCPMNLGKRFAVKDRGPNVTADVVRVCGLWAEARSRFARGGPFLYGAFSAADAMYAPVVTRLDTYQIAVDAGARAYMDAVLKHPAFVAWRDAALNEPWDLLHYEEGETPTEIFRRSQS